NERPAMKPSIPKRERSPSTQSRNEACGVSPWRRLPLLCAVVLVGSGFTSLARSPILLIEYLTGSQVRLSCSNASGTVVLEATDSLSPINVWRPLAQVPAVSNGQFSVTIDATGGSRF